MGATAMRVDRDVKVTMRDGVRISLCVYRPQAGGRVPALFAASPYQHEFDTVPAFPLFLWRETGPIEWYVAQGYAMRTCAAPAAPKANSDSWMPPSRRITSS